MSGLTRDDVVRMALESGFADDGVPAVKVGLIVRFANLVAAAEREACAGICDRFSEREMHPAECASAIRARGKGEAL